MSGASHGVLERLTGVTIFASASLWIMARSSIWGGIMP